MVITGASSGLGEALAHSFYRAGCKVVLAARREDELERVRKDLMETHSVCFVYCYIAQQIMLFKSFYAFSNLPDLLTLFIDLFHYYLLFHLKPVTKYFNPYIRPLARDLAEPKSEARYMEII